MTVWQSGRHGQPDFTASLWPRLLRKETARGAENKPLGCPSRGTVMMRHGPVPFAEMNYAEWDRAFPDEKSCIEWLVDSRWPQDVYCPRCDSDIVFPASLHEYRWRCFGCAPDFGYPFDYRTGTIFQESILPLRIWLKELHYELTGRGPGYNAIEQNMRRQIRDALRTADFRRIFGGPSVLLAKRPDALEAQMLPLLDQELCPKPARFTVLPR